jgi:hypothetical protein
MNFEALNTKERAYGIERIEPEWRMKLAELEFDLQQMDARMISVKEPKLKEEYNKLRRRFEGQMNILRAESELQTSLNKSLLTTGSLSAQFKRQVWKLSGDFQELMRFLKNHSESLAPSKEIDESELRADLSSDLSLLRSRLSFPAFTRFLEMNPDIAQIVGGKPYQEALKHIETALAHRKNPELGRRAVEIMKTELATCARAECWVFAQRLLHPHFENQVLGILENPQIRENLSQLFDLSLFEQYKLGKDGDVGTFVWLAKEAKQREANPSERTRFVSYYLKDNLVPRQDFAPPAH